MAAVLKFPKVPAKHLVNEVLSLELMRISLNDQQDRLDEEKALIEEGAHKALKLLNAQKKRISQKRAEIDAQIMQLLQS